jgi:hypothetical protein
MEAAMWGVLGWVKLAALGRTHFPQPEPSYHAELRPLVLAPEPLGRFALGLCSRFSRAKDMIRLLLATPVAMRRDENLEHGSASAGLGTAERPRRESALGTPGCEPGACISLPLMTCAEPGLAELQPKGGSAVPDRPGRSPHCLAVPPIRNWRLAHRYTGLCDNAE